MFGHWLIVRNFLNITKIAINQLQQKLLTFIYSILEFCKRILFCNYKITFAVEIFDVIKRFDKNTMKDNFSHIQTTTKFFIFFQRLIKR